MAAEGKAEPCSDISYVFGLDVGTTTSTVNYMPMSNDVQVHTVKEPAGNQTIPSVLAQSSEDDGEILVGEAADRQRKKKKSLPVARLFKRVIGLEYVGNEAAHEVLEELEGVNFGRSPEDGGQFVYKIGDTYMSSQACTTRVGFPRIPALNMTHFPPKPQWHPRPAER